MLLGYFKNQKGSTLVLVIFCMAALLGFTGLVIDVGNLYIEKSRMQTAVDMAALAGANKLPDKEEAKIVATEIVKANQGSLPVPNPQITPEITDEFSKLTVTLTKKVPTYIMRVFGITEVDVAVRAVAKLVEEGSKYTFYSTESVVFRNGEVNGGVYSGGSITLAEKVDPKTFGIHGYADAMGTIAGNIKIEPYTSAGSEYDGHKLRVTKQPMPKYSIPTIISTTIVKSDKTITSDDLKDGLNVDASGGDITLTFKGGPSSGAINMSGTGNVTLKGSLQQTGDEIKQPLFIYGSGTGTITFEVSSGQINATIYVPNGTVSLGGVSDSVVDINGCVIANKILMPASTSLAAPYSNFKVTKPTAGSGLRKTATLVD